MKTQLSEFIKATLIRALRPVAQTAAATIGTSAIITEVNWLLVASSAALAGVLSILTAIATGLPECPICAVEAAKDKEV